jgi:hypothetical protein
MNLPYILMEILPYYEPEIIWGSVPETTMVFYKNYFTQFGAISSSLNDVNLELSTQNITQLLETTIEMRGEIENPEEVL